MSGALTGLRVLDTATLYGGPMVSTLLADHGADVIKVEPPGGDSYRHHPSRMWPLLARNKRTVTLDLRSPEGSEAIRRLVPELDVIVFNMPPPLLERLGLDYDRLAALNPALIVVQLTGFGLDGPYADRPGNGTLGEALAGLTHVTGAPDGPPVLASVPLGDAVTGLTGAFGVLAACYHRLANGGQGQLIDLNPVDAMLHVVGPAITGWTGQGEPPGRLGSGLVGSVVRNVFPTRDGHWVALSVSTPRHTRDLAALVGHDEWDEDGNPTGDVEASVGAWTATRPRAELIATFVEHRLPAAPVNTAADVAVDPHLCARAAVRAVQTAESGPVSNPAPAPRLLGTPADLPWRTPDLDEHTAAVLDAVGRGEWPEP
jgi:formyl-CoA transferase